MDVLLLDQAAVERLIDPRDSRMRSKTAFGR